ncbi:MAG: substrate-binding domain-containing protein [Candidatus Marinimicrobia bacterium]|nr:substrate-binding domain-containing protein [Candidatus Neomarinimicrobiota bacterium]
MAIDRGELAGLLPSERALSRELQVSRPTLRVALRQLERDGWLAIQARPARRIVVGAPAPRGGRSAACVRLLQSRMPAAYYASAINRNYQLVERLARSGIDFKVEDVSAYALAHPAVMLKEWVLQRRADLWLLLSSPEATQRWFWQQGLPCLVLGTVFQGLALPSLDVDYQAVCRHAAGLLLARGHRSLAVIAPRGLREGDRRSLEGFRAGIAGSRCVGIRAAEVLCDDDPVSVRKAAEKLLRHRDRPDGWLVFKPQCYMTVFSALAQSGLKVGTDLSLICRDADPYFPVLVPSAAHYEQNTEQMNRRLLRLITGLLNGCEAPRAPVLVASHFHAGGSLRQRRGAARTGPAP